MPVATHSPIAGAGTGHITPTRPLSQIPCSYSRSYSSRGTRQTAMVIWISVHMGIIRDSPTAAAPVSLPGTANPLPGLLLWVL